MDDVPDVLLLFHVKVLDEDLCMCAVGQEAMGI
jgi:hypothetical protein